VAEIIWRWRAKAALVIAAATIFMILWSRQPPMADAWMAGSTDNPDNFFMWTTNGTAYNHTFTYDPHAADDWLREFGRGWKAGTNF